VYGTGEVVPAVR